MGLSKKQLKTIAILERNVQLCRDFMNDWLHFNQVLTAYPNPGVNKAQLEKQFLNIKSKLAREHRVMKDALGADYQLDANTMNIVSGATNLESIYGQSEVAVKKLQTEWHRAFIAINETLGTLEDKKARAEAGEKVFVMPAGADAAAAGAGGGITDKQKKVLIGIAIAIVVIGVMAGVPQIRNAYVEAFRSLF